MQRRTNQLRLSFPFHLALLAAAVAIAACGCGSPPATSAPGASTPPGASPAAPTTIARACELLTDADIEELTGTTVVSKTGNVADTVYANHCRWALERAGGGTGSLDVGILSPKGREVYDHSGGASGLEPIDGLPADDAGRDPLTGSIFAVRGDTLVDVFALSLGLTPEQPVEVARRVLERLYGGGGPQAPGAASTQGAGVADPCGLLTDDEILAATGHRALAHASSPRLGLWDTACVWEVDGAGTLPATITVTVKHPGGRASWDQYMVPILGEFTPIENLGDAAFGKVHWPTHVLVGDTYISVQFTDFPDPEGPISTDLARRVVEKLAN